MAARRAKPVKNYDGVQITNLEEDLEEFSLGDGGPPIKPRGGVRTKPDTVPAKRQHQSDIAKSSPTIDSSRQSNIQFGKFISEVKGPDSIWKKGYKDPVTTKSHVDPWGKPGVSSTGSKQGFSTVPTQSNIRANGSVSTQARLYNTPMSSPKASAVTMTSSSRVNQSPLSSSRGSVTSTPLNFRNPINSVHAIKKVDKSQKAFGHDAQDMYIDDIEDF